MKKLILILVLFNYSIKASERSINNSWCTSYNGVIEYRTSYGTYVDCLTNEFAIEVEFDYKWKESIGQSFHYAEATNKKPGILIIKRSQSKKDYLEELNKTIIKFNLPITIFTIDEQATQ